MDSLADLSIVKIKLSSFILIAAVAAETGNRATHRKCDASDVEGSSGRSDYGNLRDDSLYFRQVDIPMYGVSGVFSDIDDNRAHGRDERLGVREFYESHEFLDKLVKSLAGDKTVAIKK